LIIETVLLLNERDMLKGTLKMVKYKYHMFVEINCLCAYLSLLIWTYDCTVGITTMVYVNYASQ